MPCPRRRPLPPAPALAAALALSLSLALALALTLLPTVSAATAASDAHQRADGAAGGTDHHAHDHAHAHSHAHSHKHAHEQPSSRQKRGPSGPSFKLPDSPYIDMAQRYYAEARAQAEVLLASNPLPGLAHELSHRLTDLLQPLHDLPVEQAAVTASLLTSSVSLVSVVLLPFSAVLTSLLLPFAAGALLSDLAYHLLPHLYAMRPAPAPLALLLAVAFFTLLDAVLRRTAAAADAAAVTHTHTHTHGHGHGHGHGAQSMNVSLSRSTSVADDWPDAPPGPDDGASTARVAAYINLAADALHNFCDGLALAAAFSASAAAGVATTIAIMLHELPQELADFALLLRAGFGTRRALVANVVCALTALAGTVVALRASALVDGADAYILPVAAGALLYLTFATVIPDVVSDLVAPSVRRVAGKNVRVPVSFFRFVLRLVVASVSAAAGVAVVAVVESMHEH